LVPLDGAPSRNRVGATPWSIPAPFTLNISAATKVGYQPIVSYAQTVEPFCRWLVETAKARPWQEAFPVLASYPWDLFDYRAEDQYLAGL
jgi:hypothetical protein